MPWWSRDTPNGPALTEANTQPGPEWRSVTVTRPLDTLAALTADLADAQTLGDVREAGR